MLVWNEYVSSAKCGVMCGVMYGVLHLRFSPRGRPLGRRDWIERQNVSGPTVASRIVLSTSTHDSGLADTFLVNSPRW